MLAPFANLREEMDRLFNDWLKGFEPFHPLEGEAAFVPRLDVRETPEALEIVAELPGVEQKDLQIELTKDALILYGEKKTMEEEKAEGYLRNERRYGMFTRVIPLPWEVEVAKAKVVATFLNGVLTIKVPKPTEGAGGDPQDCHQRLTALRHAPRPWGGRGNWGRAVRSAAPLASPGIVQSPSGACEPCRLRRLACEGGLAVCRGAIESSCDEGSAAQGSPRRQGRPERAPLRVAAREGHGGR
jgi:HSP20 family protein